MCAEELISFSLAGKNPRAVDLLGSYLAPPASYNTEPDSDEELLDDYDSDEFDSDVYADGLGDSEEDSELEVDSEEEDEEEEAEDSDPEMEEFGDDGEESVEIDHAELAALLAGEIDEDDSDDEDFEDSADRFEQISGDEAPKKVNGKKRAADSDADVSMKSLDAPVTAKELQDAAAAEGIDLSTLSKNQKKRLNKKLKMQTGEATEPAAAAPAAAAKPAAAPAAAAAKPAAKPAAAAAPAPAAAKKQTLAGGLIVEEKKTGSGPVAKAGMKVQMRYIGKFKDGKIFDSNTKGSPFSFRLGKGEVIKGWDEGVKGMQVGSERRLTVPPALGYGSRKTGPIPANSTLYFDVKLVGMK